MKLPHLTVGLVASALLMSPSFAQNAPLPPGKPAGVRQADLVGTTSILFLLAGGIILSIALQHGSYASSTTGTSS